MVVGPEVAPFRGSCKVERLFDVKNYYFWLYVVMTLLFFFYFLISLPIYIHPPSHNSALLACLTFRHLYGYIISLVSLHLADHL